MKMRILEEVYQCKHLEGSNQWNNQRCCAENVLVCHHSMQYGLTTTDFCRMCPRHEIEGGK